MIVGLYIYRPSIMDTEAMEKMLARIIMRGIGHSWGYITIGDRLAKQLYFQKPDWSSQRVIINKDTRIFVSSNLLLVDEMPISQQPLTKGDFSITLNKDYEYQKEFLEKLQSIESVDDIVDQVRDTDITGIISWERYLYIIGPMYLFNIKKLGGIFFSNDVKALQPKSDIETRLIEYPILLDSTSMIEVASESGNFVITEVQIR